MSWRGGQECEERKTVRLFGKNMFVVSSSLARGYSTRLREFRLCYTPSSICKPRGRATWSVCRLACSWRTDGRVTAFQCDVRTPRMEQKTNDLFEHGRRSRRTLTFYKTFPSCKSSGVIVAGFPTSTRWTDFREG